VCVPRAGQGAREGLGVEGERGQSGFECDVPDQQARPSRRRWTRWSVMCRPRRTAPSRRRPYPRVRRPAPRTPRGSAAAVRGPGGSERTGAGAAEGALLGAAAGSEGRWRCERRGRRRSAGGRCRCAGEDMGEGAEGRASSVVLLRTPRPQDSRAETCANTTGPACSRLSCALVQIEASNSGVVQGAHWLLVN
jgi:hypothetical protein